MTQNKYQQCACSLSAFPQVDAVKLTFAYVFLAEHVNRHHVSQCVVYMLSNPLCKM